jgi:2-C-methyl-D-erythritol 4-phosphate cytidylyltransferase
MKNYAIILASGSGKRFNNDLPKQFANINNKTILEYSIEAFENNELIDGIILVIHPQYNDLTYKIIKNNGYKKVLKVINGGEERKDSSYIGVNSVDETEANVLIHDCARPFVSQDIIKRCVEALKENSAVAVAIPTSDTIIKVHDNIIAEVPQRSSLMRIQTPQCFRLSLIKKAHELSKNDNNFTDDCGLVLKYNLAQIHIVEGSVQNIKITTPEDIDFANFILKK